MTQQRALYQKDDENASRDHLPEEGRRRRWLLPAVLTLIAGAALLAYLLWGRPADGSLVSVQRGTIRSTVNAGGEVVSARQAQISSRVAGEVAAVPVTVGQEVLSGTVLLALATDTLEYRVRDAALRMEVARLRLERVRSGALPEEVAADFIMTVTWRCC